MKNLESIMSDDGRVLIRKSGTEPVLRIMCESRNSRNLQLAEDEIMKFESLIRNGEKVGCKSNS